MASKSSHQWLITLLGWLVACLLFFPIFWMFITSFKTEVAAVATPPQLFFQPTLENYVAVQDGPPTSTTPGIVW
jgi:sorbitol/mannitol transport system permease protein